MLYNFDREEVYAIIDSEREYQDTRWPRHLHTPEEWIVYIENYLDEAKQYCSREDASTGLPKAMNVMRKIAAMAVCAIEQNGADYRHAV